MDAEADARLTRNECIQERIRIERKDGWVCGGQQGNGAAACLVALITNRQRNNVILLPRKQITISLLEEAFVRRSGDVQRKTKKLSNTWESKKIIF